MVCVAVAQTGFISGIVSDGETGNNMRSVPVVLVDAKNGAYSDVTGKYTIKKVKPGVYSLKISYIGYATKIIDNIRVESDKTTTVNIVLKSAEKKVDEVVVTARRRTDTQEAILSQRKNASQVSDGLGKEEIAKLPDADAGQALKRVSGVTLVGDKYIYVRGSSDRYSNTTLNGSSLTTTEPDKRSFDFGMFPAEFLQQANVLKSFTPDLPGNFAGGLVQLNTIDFPDGFSIRTSMGSSANSNVQFRGNNFQSYSGGAGDWLAQDDGARSVSPYTPSSRDEMNRLIASSRRRDSVGDAAKASLTQFAQGFNSGVWQAQSLAPNPNMSFGLSYTDLFSVADNDLGVIASANYGNSYNVNTLTRSPILADRSYRQNNAGAASTRSVNYGGLLNLAYKLGTHSSVSFKNVFNRSSDDETTVLAGSDYPQGIDIRPSSWQFVQKELLSTQLQGQHTLPIQNMLLDWRFGYSQSFRDEPDFRRLRYSRQSFDSAGAFFADVQSTPQGDGTLAGRFFSNLRDIGRNGAVDVTLPMSGNMMKIKAGALVEQKNRTFAARSFTVTQPSSGAEGIDFTLSPDRLFAAENFGPGKLGMSEDSKKSDSYTASEDLTAVYAMADIPFEIGEAKFRLIGGARIEDNTQRLNSFATDNTPVDLEYRKTDVLPSLNLLWKFNDNTNIRMAASQTLTRPSLREFAPFAFYDFQSLFVVQGNPNLERTLIQNFDLRYELFPSPGEVFAVSAFYKNLTNPIEETILQVSSEYIRTFSNGRSLDSLGNVISDGNAVNYGLEFEARRTLSFLGEYLANFAVNANVALIASEITVNQGKVRDTRRMWGQSPYTVNVGLFFTEPDWGTSVNLGYNTYGSRIVQVGLVGAFPFEDPHIYERPRDIIDVTVIQPFLDGAFDLKFIARDILNQPLIWEQGGKTIASNIRGTTMSIGMSYRFQ